MNSTGTPPIVQKNRSTPGVPVSKTVTSLANDFRRFVRAAELVGQKRQRGQTLRRDVAQVLRHVEHLDEPRIAGADHRDVCAVGRRPTQRRLQNFARHPQLELHLHPDDVGQKRDEGLGRMASHDDVVQLLGHA